MSSGQDGKISFSLAKTKKGFVKPVATPIHTEGTHGPGSTASREALVIPLANGLVMGVKRPSSEVTAPQATEVYNPKKYGLQIRREKHKLEASLPAPLKSVKLSEQEKYVKDMTILPKDPIKSTYDAVPVEEFGAAILRGMGWDESKSGKEKPLEIKQRPPLLGLGADPNDPNLIKRPDYITTRKRKALPTDTIVAGSKVLIVSGEHAGLLGAVMLTKKDYTTVQLECSHEIVEVPESALSLSLKAQVQSCKDDSEPISSLHTPALVSVISKTYLEGSLYMKRGVVLDVHFDEHQEQTCTIQFKERESAHNVPRVVLRSVIPRVGAQVVLLDRTYGGHRGVLLGKTSSAATVQLADDESIIVTVPINSLSACK